MQRHVHGAEPALRLPEGLGVGDRNGRGVDLPGGELLGLRLGEILGPLRVGEELAAGLLADAPIDRVDGALFEGAGVDLEVHGPCLDRANFGPISGGRRA